MWWKLKNYLLVICLFTFLFVTLGNGLHLTPVASLIAAMSGSPLVIFAFGRWHEAQRRGKDSRAASRATEEWEPR